MPAGSEAITGHFGLGPERTFAGLVMGSAKAEALNRTAAAVAKANIPFNMISSQLNSGPFSQGPGVED